MTTNYPESQRQQREEAAERRKEQEAAMRDANAELDRDDNATLEDDDESGATGTLLPDGDDDTTERPSRAGPPRKSPQDAIRDQIAARFRRQEEQPFSGDINDPELIYGSHAREELAPEDGAPEPGVPEHQTQPPAEPRKIKLKVNGREVELTEDEVIARAQKVEAADTYLDEAKTLLKEAKQIRRSRSGADVDQDQGDVDAPHNTGEADETRSTAQDHGAKLKDVVKKIQFDDPDEAASALGEVIEEVADKKAEQRQLNRLLQNDLARSQQSLKTFREKNADIANDPMAAAVIEQNVYAIYREDIAKIGIPEDQIPKDPKTLADWHRFYRVHGHEVRTTDTILTEAHDRLVKWRGGNRGGQPQRQTQPRAEPRVNVNVDRNDRRRAIPTQPSRSAAPRPQAQPGNPKPQDRSSVISQMRQQRGQPVG
jgi:hypothetical protein